MAQKASARQQQASLKQADDPRKEPAAQPAKLKPSYKHIPHSQKPAHLVAKRNARERRRVQAVNQAFYKLRKCVPIENRNKRVSKVKTLQRAIDYIRKLERILEENPEELEPSTSQRAAGQEPAAMQLADCPNAAQVAHKPRDHNMNCDRYFSSTNQNSTNQDYYTAEAPEVGAAPADQQQRAGRRAGRRRAASHGRGTPLDEAQDRAKLAATLPSYPVNPPAPAPLQADQAPGYVPAHQLADQAGGEVLRESSAYINSLNYCCGGGQQLAAPQQYGAYAGPEQPFGVGQPNWPAADYPPATSSDGFYLSHQALGWQPPPPPANGLPKERAPRPGQQQGAPQQGGGPFAGYPSPPQQQQQQQHGHQGPTMGTNELQRKELAYFGPAPNQEAPHGGGQLIREYSL